jgi:hypothetical protein
VQRYELLTAERLPALPFTDPERTLADATVMDRMLRRLLQQARSWPSWRTSAELLKHTRGGLALHADHRWITGCPQVFEVGEVSEYLGRRPRDDVPGQTI